MIMNEQGAEAESAQAVSGSRGISLPPADFVFNKGFVVVFADFSAPKEAKGPMFAAYVDKDSWKYSALKGDKDAEY